VLTTSLPAMPEVDWDQFAARVSGAVEREEMPAQSYQISRWFSAADAVRHGGIGARSPVRSRSR
jgi:negative regulator of sigma E activity